MDHIPPVILLILTGLVHVIHAQLRFTEQPTNATVVVGMATELQCAVSGDAAILWKYNDTYISLGVNETERRYLKDSRVLVFNMVELSDEGWYQCEASTLDGSHTIVSVLSHLHVLTLQYVTSTSKIISVCNHDNVTLDCAGSWYHGNISIAPDDSRLLSNGSLQLINFTSYHGDVTYTCKSISNHSNSTHDIITNTVYHLSLSYLGEWSSDPQSQTVVKEGQRNFRFNCLLVNATPPVDSWIWYKEKDDDGNGSMVATEDNVQLKKSGSRLLIQNVTLTNAGRYWCEVSNGCDVKRSPDFQLNVLKVPIVVKPRSENISVCNHGNVMLDCAGSWYHGNKTVTPTDPQLQPNGSLTLTVTSSLGDEPYTCESISNYSNGSHGIITRVTYNLFVLDTLAAHVIPDQQTAVIGGNVSFICSPPMELTSEYQLSWHRQNEGISGRIMEGNVVMEGNRLFFQNVAISNQGEYLCEVTASSGCLWTATFRLNVRRSDTPDPSCKPINSSDVYVRSGDNISIDCLPISCDINWSRQTNLINATLYPNNSLSLTSITDDDAGEYKCLLDGSNVVVTTVTVRIATINEHFAVPLKSIEIGVGLDFNLTCEPPVADPIAMVTWFHNDTLLNSMAHYIVVTNATYSDAGNYTCQATNLAGTKTSTAFVTVSNSPLVVISNVTSQLNQSATLFCNSSQVQNFIWYHDNRTIQSAPLVEGNVNVSIVTISNVKQSDLGKYKCHVDYMKHVDTTVIGYLSHTDEPYFLDPNDNVNASWEYDSVLELSCVAVGNEVNVEWYFEIAQIHQSSDAMIITGPSSYEGEMTQRSTLKLLPSWRKNLYLTSNVIKCQISELINRTFTVTKTRKPFFLETPAEHVTATLGGVAHLFCKIAGEPVPVVKWYDVLLLEINTKLPKYLVPGNGSMFIYDVKPEDEGEYICYASFDVQHLIKLTIDQNIPPSHSEEKIGGLDEDAFLVVMGVVVMVIIYTLIMCFMLCLCCYCRNHGNSKSSSYARHEERPNSPASVVSKDAANNVVDGNYYLQLPHPFSRVNSDVKSHDVKPYNTVELSRLQQNNSCIGSGSEFTDYHDNQKMDAIFLPDLPVYPRSNLQFLSKLGDGEFGPVYKGIAHSLYSAETSTLVAIKLWSHPRDGAEESEGAISDLTTLQAQMKLQYPSIAGIVAMCTDTRPYYIIYEYLDHGDLKKFLLDCAPQDQSVSMPPSLTQQSLLKIVIQIADGMSYLSSQRIIHGDLAARNCLVSSQLGVKIADLGIGHDIYRNDYYDDSTQLLPIRWMPAEILTTAEFSVHSDAWSFGVLCWEVFSFGQLPYNELTNEQVLDMVPEGVQLAHPQYGCPQPLYHLMQQCWAMIPNDRPSFSQLCLSLIDLDID